MDFYFLFSVGLEACWAPSNAIYPEVKMFFKSE